MSDELLATLLPAIDIAAFQRRANGSFAPVAPPPPWFQRLTAGTTFPFLGHILEEAIEFWKTRQPGRRDWGPCAEVDEAGRDYHYKVTAVTVADQQYLLFQLDPTSDWAREVLQKVREQALASEQGAGAQPALVSMQKGVRSAVDDIRDLIRRVIADLPSGDQANLGTRLSTKCDDLVNEVDTLVRSAVAAAGKVDRRS